MQAWQPKEGGLLATGGEDGKLLIYNVLDTIEGVPYMCVPCASAELPEEGLTQIAWGSDNQLYTGHTSGKSLGPSSVSCHQVFFWIYWLVAGFKAQSLQHNV